jgi:hypothetical protein
MSGRSTIFWQRLDVPGHEIAELVRAGDGWELRGVAMFAHDEKPCRLDYTIECDARWRTQRVGVRGQAGELPLALELTRSARAEWHVDGEPIGALRHCIDVDLGFSPSTNLLPIRRLELAIGDRAVVRAAWVRFPTLALEVLEQVYTRLGSDSYRHESAGGTFQRDLTVSDEGWVTDYPGFWRSESVPTRDEVRRET